MLYVVYGIIGLVAVYVVLLGLVSLFVGRTLREGKRWLQSTDEVIFEKDRWLTFRPRAGEVRGGYAFYPGGYVDAGAYAWIGHEMARLGFFTVIMPMPTRIAMMKRMEAEKVIAAYPEIDRWYLGGHSLGGVVASFFARDRAEHAKLCGLILLGSFLGDTRDQSSIVKLPTLSVYGTKDGHADSFEPTRGNISADVDLRCIQGGNHRQFGMYGLHFGDGEAEITRDSQREQTATFLQEFTDRVSGPVTEAAARQSA